MENVQTTNTTASAETLAKKTFEQRQVSETQVTLIDDIKTKAAILLETLQNQNDFCQSQESKRLFSLAKTSLEESVMWATKAVSRFN